MTIDELMVPGGLAPTFFHETRFVDIWARSPQPTETLPDNQQVNRFAWLSADEKLEACRQAIGELYKALAEKSDKDHNHYREED